MCLKRKKLILFFILAILTIACNKKDNNENIDIKNLNKLKELMKFGGKEDKKKGKKGE